MGKETTRGTEDDADKDGFVLGPAGDRLASSLGKSNVGALVVLIVCAFVGCHA